MKYGYHYSPCSAASSGPGLWLLLKLAAIVSVVAGVWWVLRAIGRAAMAAVDAVSGAATAAGPVVLGALGAVGLMFVLGVALVIVRNNQRPPLIPHDRPDRLALAASTIGESTVEVIAVTPNRPRLDPPRPVYRPLASHPRSRVAELAR